MWALKPVRLTSITSATLCYVIENILHMQALIGYALQFLRQRNEKMVHVYC